ncbi:hypothetical protein FNZ56_04465 [Pseudoluteimonas lycopersici]|uniref:DUF4864 domain-containing protein n=1 Tax=Pseudoluteimonas lycopersici TaxID=1324796 RepID=A0A516V3X6_9GAMM|nr:hypothetical protein [Lysobacter lycopersici]QDQ73177.1 hypothetical protein FNZ56_04465 [Lysobacter lycopersici]
MRGSSFFLAVFLFLMSPIACAAKLENLDSAVALTDQVMRLVSSGDLKGGFDLMKPYAVVPPAEIDAASGQAELQKPLFLARFGKSIGYELIRKDEVGSSVAQVIYLQKFEKHAMVWRFILYRGNDGWTVNSFKFVDDITTAF